MLALAEQLRHATSLLIFGRGFNYATALEAALKVPAACRGSGDTPWTCPRLPLTHEPPAGQCLRQAAPDSAAQPVHMAACSLVAAAAVLQVLLQAASQSRPEATPPAGCDRPPMGCQGGRAGAGTAVQARAHSAGILAGPWRWWAAHLRGSRACMSVDCFGPCVRTAPSPGAGQGGGAHAQRGHPGGGDEARTPGAGR